MLERLCISPLASKWNSVKAAFGSETPDQGGQGPLLLSKH